MAHGKSEELANITRTPARRVCICGKDYESHLNEDGVLPPDMSDKHWPKGQTNYGVNRRQRRLAGFYKKPTR